MGHAGLDLARSFLEHKCRGCVCERRVIQAGIVASNWRNQCFRIFDTSFFPCNTSTSVCVLSEVEMDGRFYLSILARTGFKST